MRRHEITEAILIPLLELTGMVGIFFIAYNLRQITDGIPGVQLPIPYISPEQFMPFVLSGIVFWGVIFSVGGLYTHAPEKPLFDTIRGVIFRASLWFLLYIGFVYLTIGFIFSKEIPRLIIGYVYILSTLYAILLRVCVHMTLSWLYKNGYLKKSRVLVIGEKSEAQKILTEKDTSLYIYHPSESISEIEDLIRKRGISRVLLISSLSDREKIDLIRLCAIYAIPFAYPRILPEVYSISQRDSFIGGIPVIESTALRIGAWGRIVKRLFDIIGSALGLIVLSPLFLVIAIMVKLEDPSGPAIYRNRRIGYDGKEFFLYKFRYMYWKYSVKDAYGILDGDDSALRYEEELKKKSDTRSGPLYKIAHDPRKTKVGKILETLSLDELPQLWNVLIGNMSLVGPRPHQPREVELYDEHHHQVLTVKPGITGMAQVFGREKNTFEDEVRYDVYYIEHYSLLLDILILGKTFFVILSRAVR